MSPVAMLPGGELPPRFMDTSDEEVEGDDDGWEVDESVGDEMEEAGDESVGDEEAGDAPDSAVVKTEVKDEPLDGDCEVSYSIPSLFVSSYIPPFFSGSGTASNTGQECQGGGH